MVEQINTIDKHRIHRYAGHLTAEQMAQIDLALGYSLGLAAFPEKERIRRQRDKGTLLCLCPACRSKFFDTKRYYITRSNPHQKEKYTCTFCQTVMGYDYYVKSYQRNQRSS